MTIGEHQYCWVTFEISGFLWGKNLLTSERQTFLLVHRRWEMFREEERLRLSDRNSILTTKNLSKIRSEALIGRWSNFIVLAIVYKWQTKDKRLQKVKCKRDESLENSQYLWNNIVFSRSSIWVLLELIRRWTQRFTKIDQEKRKTEQICIWNPMTTGWLCKHWFTSLVWNFCRWVADVPVKRPSAAMREEF